MLVLLIMTAALFCGCNSDGEQSSDTEPTTQSVTAAPTTAAPTTLPATPDSAKKGGYDYVAIKKNSGEIISQFDKIVAEKKFNGSIYMKLGTDFEYISSTGSANNNKHIDNSINTRFYVGDITKQFTAAAVMQLSEKNKLSLDKTIDNYLPDYSFGEKITVKQLLNMTAGIKTYVNHNEITNPQNYINGELAEKLSEDNSAEQNKSIIHDWIYSQELSFEPGTQFYSSESNYFLLGEIIEQVSGESYYSYLENEIFNPLGMGSTNFEPDEKMAVAYENGAITKSLNYSGVGYSAYGLISNVSDLLKWTDSLLSNQVLSEKSFKQIFSNQLANLKDNKKSYGFGVNIDNKSVTSINRYDAFSSVLIYNTDKSEIYIALTNNTSSDNAELRSSFKKSIQKYAL